ncbi:MAG: hypothetical protein ACTHMY_17295 [Solirubrobacteraceae bacterium]
MATIAAALLLALTSFSPHYRLVGHHGVATDGRYTVLWSVRRGELYLPASDEWRAITVAAACRRVCVPLAVGTDWIEYDKRSRRRGDRFIFQNIATGALLGDPTNATTVADLDSPVLAQPVCPPLRVPRHGTLTLNGRFAVAAGATGTFIEKCGTHLRVPVSSENVAAAPGSFVWLTSATRPMSGVLLPSLKRFTVAAPTVHVYLVDVELSSRHIYVTVSTGGGGADVWSAPAPGPAIRRSR